MHEKQPYSAWINEDFKLACRDYFYLVDHHFPERGVLKLVGDRYRLGGDQRTVLYRGISSRKRSDMRHNLLVQDITGKTLIIDGYNVLFTLLNYRLGKITFLSTDHILRDAGSLHGKFREEQTFDSCIELLLNHLNIKQPARVEVYLDAPVSHSEKHARWLRDKMTEKQLSGESYVVKSADWALRHSVNCVLATSDTGIIDAALQPVIDLPAAILINVYQAEFLRLSDLLSADEPQDTIDKG